MWVAIILSTKPNYRNRGTEFIKSPEMLLVANASKKEAKWYDRRKRQGAGEDSVPSPISALPNEHERHGKNPEKSGLNRKGGQPFHLNECICVGAPSDIWSLGCLLFEIIAGDYLFHDEDWIRFFIRVTQAHEASPLPPLPSDPFLIFNNSVEHPDCILLAHSRVCEIQAAVTTA